MINDNVIEIKNFNLSYGKVQLFSNFDFSVKKGICAGIFGPTGTGKTTLLNKIVDDYITKYRIAYVFQDNKLIENLNVVKNVGLPLEKIIGKSNAEKKATEIINTVNLMGKCNEKVAVLSGGERQRVNLARAFGYLEAGCDDRCEKVLLMDEPFSAQDENNRKKLIELTRKVCKENSVTSVIVSHNMDDLEELCNFVVKLHNL